MAQPPGDAPARFDRMFDGTSASLNLARLAVAAFLEGHHLNSELIERAKLVISELSTNAIQASPGESYRVRVLAPSDRLVIQVANRGHHVTMPSKDSRAVIEPLATRGRGLSIIEALADAVEFERLDGGWLQVTAFVRRSEPKGAEFPSE